MAGLRTWGRLTSTGHYSAVQLERQKLGLELGVQVRGWGGGWLGLIGADHAGEGWWVGQMQ